MKENEFLARHGDITVVFCHRCGFAHQSPRPSIQETNDIYLSGAFRRDHTPGGWLEKEAREQDYWRLRFAEMLDVARVQGAPPGRVLDVGCGAGWFLAFASEQGWQAVGVDLDSSWAEHVRAHAPDAIFLPGDFSLLDLTALAPFQVIRMSLVLEHLHDPGKALEVARRLLADDGILYIEVPNDFNPLQNMLLNRGFEPWWIHPIHINYFSLQALTNLLVTYGFRNRAVAATFPMELFLLSGLNYLENPDIGLLCHNQRMAIEQTLSDNPWGREALWDWRQWLARCGIGRELMVWAAKDLDFLSKGRYNAF